MCGFAGFIDRKRRHSEAARRAILVAMGRQLARRGPDEEQIYDDDDLAFVFRRLSIVDLVTGHQPIWNEDGTLFVAVNGEIYNHLELRSELRDEHRFRTRSDAEILLHLYEERGPAALDSLIGMFAAVIWNPGEQRLFLARDRVGIKPLYYAETDGLFLFASELKALLVHPDCPRQLRWRDVQPSFHDVPAFASVPTYVEGTDQLLGGHWATYQQGVFQSRRYWALETFFPKSEDGAKTAAEYVDAYAELFADSARKRLMSDVPIGSFLSGGLDSSLVTAVAAESSRDLHCFNVLTRTTFQSGDADAARRLATALRLPFHQVLFDHDDLADRLDLDLAGFEYYVWLLDSPRFDLEWLFKHELHRYAKTVVPDLKVILLGQGADEFAGGYSNVYGSESYATEWAGYLETLRTLDREDFIAREGVHEAIAPLLADSRAGLFADHERYRHEMRRRVRWLQGYNLWHEDRTGTGQGIEPRVPFLDHRLLELLASIPPRLHAELFWDKRLIREAARRWLPADVVDRRKVGFFVARDMSSIDDLSRRILHRVFPEFRDRYLREPDPLFSEEPLVALFTSVDAGGRTARDATRMLFACMAIAVFETLCRAPSREIRGLDPPSPLNEVAAGAPESWGPPVDDAIPRWAADDQIHFDASVRVVSPISAAGAGKEVCFLRNGVIEQEVEIMADMDWVFTLLRRLSERKEPSRLRELSETLGVSLADLTQTLDFLFAGGWIVKAVV